MRAAVILALLLGTGASGLHGWRRAAALPSRLPPGCARRVELRGAAGFDELVCAEVLGPALALAGRPAGCPAALRVRDGDRLSLSAGGGCELSRERMAGPALRLLGLPVDVNRASVEDLEALPGVGPTLALRILEARPFGTLAELRSVPGIGPRRWAAIAGSATVGN